jgi:hypothetical protein
LYQKKNFKYYNDAGVLENYKPAKIGDTEISDIKVKNVVFGFGAEVSNLPKGGVKVYTNDSTNFRSDDNEDDNRTLRLQWYNSSENNEYIGFSDGVYDPDYNEENYLSAAAANTRLLARRSEIYSDDELSLSLLADGYDIYNAANSAKQLIDKNLPELLRGFRSYLSGIVWSSGDPFATLLGADTGSLGDIARAIGDNASKVNNQYKEVFKWVKSTKQDLDKKPEGINNDDVETDFTTPIVSSIESVITATDAIYNTVLTTVNTTYSSYENIYTSYKNKWDALKEKINNLKTNINTWHSNSDGETNTTKLGKIWDKVEGFDLTAESIVPYTDKTTTETFKNAYDNKYCIYWYRYNNEYIEKDPFMEAGWEKLENSMNVGLPGA